jgi:hypothetical protein
LPSTMDKFLVTAAPHSDEDPAPPPPPRCSVAPQSHTLLASHCSLNLFCFAGDTGGGASPWSWTAASTPGSGTGSRACSSIPSPRFHVLETESWFRFDLGSVLCSPVGLLGSRG